METGGPSLSQLIASIVIGSAGFVLLFAGNKRGEWKPMTSGVVLMCLPLLIRTETLLMCLGAVLVMAALYVYRD